MIQRFGLITLKWGRHRFTQEEISSPQGFVIILVLLISLSFFIWWIAFGKDARKTVYRVFPPRRNKDSDMHYLGSIIALLCIWVFLILLLISSISGVGLEEFGR